MLRKMAQKWKAIAGKYKAQSKQKLNLLDTDSLISSPGVFKYKYYTSNSCHYYTSA